MSSLGSGRGRGLLEPPALSERETPYLRSHEDAPTAGREAGLIVKVFGKYPSIKIEIT